MFVILHHCQFHSHPAESHPAKTDNVNLLRLHVVVERHSGRTADGVEIEVRFRC